MITEHIQLLLPIHLLLNAEVPTDACEEPQGAEVVEGESHPSAIPDAQIPATFKIRVKLGI